MSLVSAATFVAVVGDIGRFETPKKLVGYVGLDPKLRQSGEHAARHSGISKQGSAAARHMLCEAAWIAVRTPGPLRAFYERLRARRGAQIALVATGRKLCVLFWHLLSRAEDYAFERPSLTRHKLRPESSRSWLFSRLLAFEPERWPRRGGSPAISSSRAGRAGLQSTGRRLAAEADERERLRSPEPRTSSNSHRAS